MHIGKPIALYIRSGPPSTWILYPKEEIPVVGLKTSGVKGIKLVSDSVVSAFVTNENHE